MFRTHPLDLHEIRSRIAGTLGVKDLASCARVSQDWNDSFTPPLYNFVVLSYSLGSRSIVSFERNKHLIQHLKIQSLNDEDLSSTYERYKVIPKIIANSILTTLYSEGDSIGEDGFQALLGALKTNSTLTTLNLILNSIGDSGAQVLAEALKTNSILTFLDLQNNSIGPNGAQALFEARNTNLTLILFIL